MSNPSGDLPLENDSQAKYLYGVHVLLTEDDEGATVWRASLATPADTPSEGSSTPASEPSAKTKPKD